MQPKNVPAGISPESQAAINRRRRRRVMRTVAGAVIGAVIAGPLGAAAGAVVGASRKRGPARRKPSAGPKLTHKTKAAKASKPGKTRPGKQRPGGKRPMTNIYPPIP